MYLWFQCPFGFLLETQTPKQTLNSFLNVNRRYFLSLSSMKSHKYFYVYHQLYFKIIQFRYINSMAIEEYEGDCRVPCKEARGALWIQKEMNMTSCFVWSCPLGLCYVESLYLIYTCYEKRSMFASLLWQMFRFNKARDEPEVVGPGCFVQTCTIICVWSSHSAQFWNPDADIFDLAWFSGSPESSKVTAEKHSSLYWSELES